MNDNTHSPSIDNLVEEFRQFLSQGQASPEDSEDAPESPERVDLFRLFAELAALKSEIKRESRQVKEAITRFGALYDTLREHNQRLTGDLSRERELGAEQWLRKKKSLLLEILDLKDRLESTVGAIDAYQPGWRERRIPRTMEFRRNLREGLDITLRRVEQMLADHGVARLDTLGKAPDPHWMRVAELRSEPAQEEGVVIDELVAGYRLGDDLLRLAEVVVNRSEKS